MSPAVALVQRIAGARKTKKTFRTTTSAAMAIESMTAMENPTRMWSNGPVIPVPAKARAKDEIVENPRSRKNRMAFSVKYRSPSRPRHALPYCRRERQRSCLHDGGGQRRVKHHVMPGASELWDVGARRAGVSARASSLLDRLHSTGLQPPMVVVLTRLRDPMPSKGYRMMKKPPAR